MVLIGTNDLLADWGIPGQYDHPRVREAYEIDHRGLPPPRQARRRRRPHHRPNLVAEFVRMGARYVSTGTDLGFLLSACTAKAKEVAAMTARP